MTYQQMKHRARLLGDTDLADSIDTQEIMHQRCLDQIGEMADKIKDLEGRLKNCRKACNVLRESANVCIEKRVQEVNNLTDEIKRLKSPEMQKVNTRRFKESAEDEWESYLRKSKGLAGRASGRPDCETEAKDDPDYEYAQCPNPLIPPPENYPAQDTDGALVRICDVSDHGIYILERDLPSFLSMILFDTGKDGAPNYPGCKEILVHEDMKQIEPCMWCGKDSEYEIPFPEQESYHACKRCLKARLVDGFPY